MSLQAPSVTRSQVKVDSSFAVDMATQEEEPVKAEQDASLGVEGSEVPEPDRATGHLQQNKENLLVRYIKLWSQIRAVTDRFVACPGRRWNLGIALGTTFGEVKRVVKLWSQPPKLACSAVGRRVFSPGTAGFYGIARSPLEFGGELKFWRHLPTFHLPPKICSVPGRSPPGDRSPGGDC